MDEVNLLLVVEPKVSRSLQRRSSGLQMCQLQICQLQMYQRCFENIKNCKCGNANEANCKLLNGKVENGKNGVANEELQIRNCKYGRSLLMVVSIGHVPFPDFFTMVEKFA